MKTTIAGVEFKNPIIAASGMFGFGREYNEFYDVGKLGG
ncbi:MAG: dihydroorotate dehydrogenase, partial [Clostridiales bacterium]|nr:dihydroorotate dehydrogenase [Clostridiales bacterium]